MKNVKIRFIKHLNFDDKGKNIYSVQIKKWYGWKDLSKIAGNEGGIYQLVINKEDKKELIEEVYKYFKTTSKYLSITEYPTIKKY